MKLQLRSFLQLLCPPSLPPLPFQVTSLGGTQSFELPRKDTSLRKVFEAVMAVKEEGAPTQTPPSPHYIRKAMRMIVRVMIE